MTNTTDISTERTPGSLKPRAIAALCSLRQASASESKIARAIGDEHLWQTVSLLDDIAALGLVALGSAEPTWRLTHDGIGWCETNGMPVSAKVKREALQP